MQIRKVIVVLGLTQYGVLTRFAKGIMEGVQELGIQVDVSSVIRLRRTSGTLDIAC